MKCGVHPELVALVTRTGLRLASRRMALSWPLAAAMKAGVVGTVAIAITIRKHWIYSTSSRGPVGPIDRGGCDLLVPSAGMFDHTSWHPCLTQGATPRPRASCGAVSATNRFRFGFDFDFDSIRF